MKRFSIFFLTLLTVLVMAGTGWADDILAQQTSHPHGSQLNDPSWEGIGQAFTISNPTGKKITSVTFILSKTNSPTGTGVAKLYDATGTVGTDGRPTNSALATSDTVTLSTLSATPGTAVNIAFSGANQIVPTDNTVYVLTFEVSTMTSTDYINTQQDEGNPDATQNKAYNLSGTWYGTAATDLYFILYGVSAAATENITAGDLTLGPMTMAGTLSHGPSILTGSDMAVGPMTMAGQVNIPKVYYMRADGTAATAAEAVGPTSTQANCMNVAVHNASTFYGGDTIKLSDKGGTYTTAIVAPSSGDDSATGKIIYAVASGETPVFDLSHQIGNTGWGSPDGNGVYHKNVTGVTNVMTFFENGNALQWDTDATCTHGGNWYYAGSGYDLYYKPTSGTPTGKDLQGMWFGSDTPTWGAAIDLRDKSNIEISGLTINRGGILFGQNFATDPAVSLIKNIKIHGNIITQAFWGVYGDTTNNGILQDVEIYSNTLNYCKCGISSWDGGNPTDAGHTQKNLRINIHNNTINDVYSIDANLNWVYALYNGYIYDDNEGISLQDPVDCTVNDNTITVTATPVNTSGSGHPEYEVRPISIFTTTNTAVVSSGNKFLRNRITGKYTYGLYWAGNVSASSGAENNIFACNVFQSSIDSEGIYIHFYATYNQATGRNYILNNTLVSVGTVRNAIYLGNSTSDLGLWTIENNIISGAAKGANVLTSDPSYLTFNYNNYYCPVSLSGGYYWMFGYNGGQLTTINWPGTYGYDATGSHYNIVGNDEVSNPVLDANSAITASSPTWCKTGGTTIGTITGITGITAWPMTGVDAIDGNELNATTPTMGAYAEVEAQTENITAGNLTVGPMSMAGQINKGHSIMTGSNLAAGPMTMVGALRENTTRNITSGPLTAGPMTMYGNLHEGALKGGGGLGLGLTPTGNNYPMRGK